MRHYSHLLPCLGGGDEIGLGDPGGDAALKEDEAAVGMVREIIAAGARGGGDDGAVLGVWQAVGGIKEEPGGALAAVWIDKGGGPAGVFGVCHGVVEIGECEGPAPCVLGAVLEEEAMIELEQDGLMHP